MINSLSNLPDEKDPLKRMYLKIGESFKEVDFFLFLDLVVISRNRINMDLSEVKIKELVESSPKAMEELKKP